MKLENVKAGRKGNLNVATEVIKHFLNWFRTNYFPFFFLHNSYGFFIFQIFQVAPSLHMVEVRKAKGDTLEFHKVLKI